ncbi:MAG: glycerol-3-phosphate 1-O-acyltransferase PlsY [Phycisphaerae bacterium]
MPNDLFYLLMLAAPAFLVGSLPIGYWVGLSKGIDLRTRGSGNIGTANVWRNLGMTWGIAVFLLDVGKGLLPAIIVGAALRGWEGLPLERMYSYWLSVAIFPVLGHNFSPFLGFKGGKGVATSFGVAIGVYPHLTIPALAAFFVWCAIAVTLKISSLGSLLAALAFPIGYVAWASWEGWERQPRWPFVVFTTLTATMVVVLHRGNIVRLLQGKENKLSKQPSSTNVDQRP